MRELLASEDAQAPDESASWPEELTTPEEEPHPTKSMIRPYLPAEAGIEKHRIDHLPYHDWCPECVEGFGRERAHHVSCDHQQSTPLVSCDYMYLSRSGVFAREELPQEERDAAIRVIVAKCSKTQALFAHVVPQKGVDPDGYVVEQLRHDILWLGIPGWSFVAATSRRF